MKKYLIIVLTAVMAMSAAAATIELKPEVAAWLQAQTNIQSWSADFTQTRSLKSLSQPLTANGHVWFQAPNRFRWELGHPAQTIALRSGDELQVIYPKLKRVERFPLTGQQAGPWRDALALLQAGFPRSAAELEAEYNILSQAIEGDVGKLALQPKSAAARRMMPQIVIEFDVKNFALRATELEFADGSRMRNDFKNPTLNPTLQADLFTPNIPSDYKVVEPLKKQ